MSNAVTLNPGTLDVTLTGTITAYGTIGTYTIIHDNTLAPQTVEAAVFAPKIPGASNQYFTISNTGVILSAGTSQTDFGILLAGQGIIRNTGSITGGAGIGLAASGENVLINSGAITGTTGDGVDANSGAAITNDATGTITSAHGQGIDFAGGQLMNEGDINAYLVGVTNAGQLSTIINSGTIDATGTMFSAAGISLAGGGISNQTGGLIEGYNAIVMTSGTVANASRIQGTGKFGAGVLLDGSGTLTNQSAGTIGGVLGVAVVANASIYNNGLMSGSSYGVAFSTRYTAGPLTDTLVNHGTINGSLSGIEERGKSTDSPAITNASAATISGAIAVDDVSGLINLTNAGTIIGGKIAIDVSSNGGIKTGLIINSGLIESGLTGPVFYEAIAAAGATLTNSATGTISAGNGDGVSAKTVSNAGLITAAFGIEQATSVINSGTIIAGLAGVDNSVSVTNSGLIEATGSTFAVVGGPSPTTLAAAAIFDSALYNSATGRILATQGYGVERATTVTNAGAITGYRAGISGLGNVGTTIHNTGDITVTGTAFAALQNTITYGRGIALSGGYISNAGTIAGATGIYSGGVSPLSLTIVNTGVIDGATRDGIAIHGSTATIENSGVITGAASSGTGINLSAGGIVENQEGGIISGGTAIAITNGTLTNAGLIGATATGANISGLIANQLGGTIAGATGLAITGTAVNAGLIESTTTTGTGIALTGTLINQVTGIITGATAISATGTATIENSGAITATNTAIIITNGGTIENSGVITGAPTAIAFAAGFTNLLELATLSTIAGKIDLNGTLELQAGPATGHLNAAELQNLTALTIDASAAWQFNNAFTAPAGATITNNGTIKDHGALTLAGPITGDGAIILDAAKLTLKGAVAATQTLSFSDTNETLALAAPGKMKATLHHFALADTIDLTTLPFGKITGAHFAAGILTLSESATRLTFTFANPASFGTETFALAADGTGTAITLAPAAAAATTQAWLSPTRQDPHILPNLITLHP